MNVFRMDQSSYRMSERIYNDMLIPLIFLPPSTPYSSLLIRGSMGVGSKGKRERARGLMGSDFCRILPRLAPEGKGEKRGFKEGV
ncbi:hypothetical protein C7123_02970 [Tannerella serpentiformis]|nr:hypothetical protein C7123_02970 [Tannerella serpentiformis]